MEAKKSITKLDNLKKIREKKNYTQLKVATDLGVTQELISRYELGYSFPQANMLIALSKYFNCSVDYLLGLTDIETPLRYLTSNYNADLVAKYDTLSKNNKVIFDKFLNYLIDDTSKGQ